VESSGGKDVELSLVVEVLDTEEISTVSLLGFVFPDNHGSEVVLLDCNHFVSPDSHLVPLHLPMAHVSLKDNHSSVGMDGLVFPEKHGPSSCMDSNAPGTLDLSESHHGDVGED